MESQSINFGSFSLHPSEAKFYQDENLIFKPDPYVCIRVGDREFKTTVDRKGGLNPHWNNCFNIGDSEEGLAHIKVYDKDLIVPDNLLGEAIVTLRTMYFGQTRLQRIDLFKGGRKSGEIALEFMPSQQQEQSPEKNNLEDILKPLTATEGKSFIQKVKEEITTIGLKANDFGKAIEEKLGFGHHSQQQEQSHELPREAMHSTTEDVESINKPVVGPLTYLKEGLTQGVYGFQPTNENAEFRKSLDSTEASFSTPYSSVEKPKLLDKGSVEYFGQFDEDQTQQKDLKASDPRCFPLQDEALKALEQNTNDQGITFGNSEPFNERADDNWSTVSNQGSVLDKAEADAERMNTGPLSTGSDLSFRSQDSLVDQAKGESATKEPSIWDKGKYKLEEIEREESRLVSHIAQDITKVFCKDPVTGKPGLWEKSKQRISEFANKVDESLHITHANDQSTSRATQENHPNIDLQTQGTKSLSFTSPPFIVEKSKETITDFSHRVQDILKPKEDPLHIDLQAQTTGTLPFKSPPSIVQKSKEQVTDFTHKMDEVLNQDNARTADFSSIEIPEEECLLRIDVVDVGPQDCLDLPKQEGSPNARKEVEFEFVRKKSYEMQKEGIAEEDLQGEAFLSKAQESIDMLDKA